MMALTFQESLKRDPNAGDWRPLVRLTNRFQQLVRSMIAVEGAFLVVGAT
jgi:hypothetical protein